MKNSFIKYPAIIFAVSFISSLFFILLLPTVAKAIIWAVLITLTLVSFLLLIKHKNKTAALPLKYTLLISLSLIFSILISIIQYDIPMFQAQKYVDKTKTVTAYVKEVSYDLDHTSAAYCVITQADGKSVNIPVYLQLDCKLGIEPFEYFKGELTFSSLEQACDGYHSVTSFISDGVRLVAYSDKQPIPTGRHKEGILPFFAEINQAVCNRINDLLDLDSAALVNAVLFGNKSSISTQVKRDFYTLGITHLLVVSGMNIAIVAGMLELVLLRVFKLKRWMRSAVCSLACLIYMALCGFSLTVIRAALMQVLCRLSINAKAGYHPLTSLFISISVICTFFPGAVYDIGLILSFLATLGIIIYGAYTEKSIRKLPKIAKNIVAPLVTSISASIFVLPISYYVFGKFSIIAPVSSMIFGVFLDILLYITPLWLIISYIPILGPIASYGINLLCKAVLKLTSYAYLFKDLYVSFDFDGAELLLILLLITVIISFVLKTKKKYLKPLPAFAVFFAICLACFLNSNVSGVHYYRNKSNDGIIINNQSQTTVIDISSGSKLFATNLINQAYSVCNTTWLDGYVLTHYHQRQVTTIDHLLSSTYLSSVSLPIPSTLEEIEIFNQIDTVVKKHGATLYTYENELDIWGITLTKAPSYYLERSTHPIVCFRLTGDKEDAAYFSGGAFEVQSNEIDQYATASTLIFGDHGPITKQPISSSAFSHRSKALFSSKELDELCLFEFDSQSYDFTKPVKLFTP